MDDIAAITALIDDVVDVVFVRPDVAIATTVASAGGPASSIVTWVLDHQDDGWWVRARQFTRVTG